MLTLPQRRISNCNLFFNERAQIFHSIFKRRWLYDEIRWPQHDDDVDDDYCEILAATVCRNKLRYFYQIFAFMRAVIYLPFFGFIFMQRKVCKKKPLVDAAFFSLTAAGVDVECRRYALFQ